MNGLKGGRQGGEACYTVTQLHCYTVTGSQSRNNSAKRQSRNKREACKARTTAIQVCVQHATEIRQGKQQAQQQTQTNTDKHRQQARSA
jgi:hypothetical protein